MEIENLFEALTPENFHTSRPTIEVAVPTIPTWLKWFAVVVTLGLIIVIARAFSKAKEEKQNQAEIKRLNLLNQELLASKTVLNERLSRYEPK